MKQLVLPFRYPSVKKPSKAHTPAPPPTGKAA